MEFQVDVWLRGTDFASTALVTRVPSEPPSWTDNDVAYVLREMLRAIYRAKNPSEGADAPVFLRGFSWIVNPFEESGVIIAIEIQSGAAVAGPFQVGKEQLEAQIARAIALGARGDVPIASVH